MSRESLIDEEIQAANIELGETTDENNNVIDSLLYELESPLPIIDIPGPPPPTPDTLPICHYQTQAVDVLEDYYGTYVDQKGKQHQIKRFTWRNYNKLTVSVITYGARIITMKAPNKNGQIADILLGFDDIGGYVRNGDFQLGACLGRCANVIKESTCSIDGKIINLTKNLNNHHHINGGIKSFDKVVWIPYVTKSKVIMTYVSDNNEEGYPGQLFTKLTFELCEKNRFKIDYEAYCTEPTIINLTHLCYFNLDGSNKGPDEIYKHILTINSNCYTLQDTDNITTGEIKNVVNTRYDFQIPKCLSKVINLVPNDGYNQNFCINSGVNQEESFVSRLFHPPSGRMLEIYSSHKGAVLTTGNEFGTGVPKPINELLAGPYTCSTTSLVVENIYKSVKEIFKIDQTNDYFEMRDLIDLIKSVKLGDRENMEKIELTKMQREYLEKIFHYCHSCEPKIQKCQDILEAIEAILVEAKSDPPSEVVLNITQETEIRERILSQFSSKMNQLQETLDKKSLTVGKITGKGDYVYKRHCGVAITPGNYPNAINIKSFPNVVLRPGEVYKHSTSFKFWVRAGNPNNWIKRKIREEKKSI